MLKIFPANLDLAIKGIVDVTPDVDLIVLIDLLNKAENLPRLPIL
jgi:hypothetical protein